MVSNFQLSKLFKLQIILVEIGRLDSVDSMCGRGCGAGFSAFPLDGERFCGQTLEGIYAASRQQFLKVGNFIISRKTHQRDNNAPLI